jgi:hypothetical protein
MHRLCSYPQAAPLCSSSSMCSCVPRARSLLSAAAKGEKFNPKGEKFNPKGEKFNPKGEKFNPKGERKIS